MNERTTEFKVLARSVVRSLDRTAELAGLQLSLRGELGRSWDKFFRHLKKINFAPDLVVDVGTAYGTHDIYRHFPDARYLFIEPLVEFEVPLRKLCAQLDAKHIAAAAGSRRGQIEINVHDDLDESSVHREVAGGGRDGVLRTVDMIRIDDVADVKSPSCRMLKIDVQGAELDVLAGAAQFLSQTEVVILEVSLIRTMDSGPELAEVVAYMGERGFVVFDMIGGLERPLDGSLAQVDLVFVPEQHRFRTDRRWRQLC